MYHKNVSDITLVYRISTILWSFPASLVLVCVYKAVYLSLLAFPAWQYLVSGISDLPNHPEIQVFTYKGSTTEEFFLVLLFLIPFF